jgi:two-component system, chemotaxis family, protein-glutamate methylesterase/glutaminase
VSVVEFGSARLRGQNASAVRVMVVDDSAVARGFLRRWLDAEPGMELVASLRTGREALDRFERADPDVVVLDIDMPDMDGITALPHLLAKKPTLAVIIASTLTRRNSEVTLKALSLGALDCVQKPDAQGAMSGEAYRQYLISKIRVLGKRTRQGSRTPGRPGALPLAHHRLRAPMQGAATSPHPLSLRPMPISVPRVLVIGASTGGPQALTGLCSKLGAVIDQAPVLVTQHMPPTFTTILAEHLARATGRAAREAIDGEPIRAGQIYVAPGNRHLRVARANGVPVATLDDSAPVNFCKPSVDVMFSSAAEVWGGWVLGVVLTGMGSDGTNGAADIVHSGGAIFAQDEATSVVWGMPGSVAEAGLCSKVMPLNEIAPTLSQLFLGRRS